MCMNIWLVILCVFKYDETCEQFKIYIQGICYGTQPVDCNELFLLLLIPGEYLSW